MFERLYKFYEIGNAFIVTKGSIGTLNELFLFWVLVHQGFININNKPIILFGDFWNDFLNSLQNLNITENQMSLLKIISTPDNVIKYLKEFTEF